MISPKLNNSLNPRTLVLSHMYVGVLNNRYLIDPRVMGIIIGTVAFDEYEYFIRNAKYCLVGLATIETCRIFGFDLIDKIGIDHTRYAPQGRFAEVLSHAFTEDDMTKLVLGNAFIIPNFKTKESTLRILGKMLND